MKGVPHERRRLHPARRPNEPASQADQPRPGVAARIARGPPQPAPGPRQPPAGDLRADPADFVRAAVRVRLRRGHCRLQPPVRPVRDPGHHRPDGGVCHRRDRNWPQRGSGQGHHRPLPVPARRILADSVRLTATVVAILGVGMLLGFRITTSPLAALAGFVLIIAFGIALSWVAALIGLSVRNPETAQSAGFIWMFPLTFASSAFVVASTMPGWLQPFVRINPISVAADALRGLLLAGPVLTPVLKTVAWIVALTVVFAPLAIRQFRRLA